jgi:hypothetical protein
MLLRLLSLGARSHGTSGLLVLCCSHWQQLLQPRLTVNSSLRLQTQKHSTPAR